MDLVSREEWFEQLIAECGAILVEFGFRSNLERVRMYHELGKRILQDNHNFERHKIYGQDVVGNTAKALGVGERTVHYAVAFAKKYPSIEWEGGELGGLPYGKSLTWTKVVHELLPDGKVEKEKKKRVCPSCGFVLNA